MAGLAATLNVPDVLEPLGLALAPRGPDGASCRVEGAHGIRLEVLVRAVMPAIVRVVAASSEPEEPPVVAAIAVDGVASMSALDADYATEGPAGLLRGRDPYAVVLADAEREILVLARNGAAAGLYYARLGEGWVVASEPGALLAAGVPARPYVDVVRRFIASGAVDDTAATFFDGIAQVRPNEVVVLERDGTARAHRGEAASRRRSVVSALDEAIGPNPVAVLVRPGPFGAAVLGAALARPGAAKPLPVHTAVFPDLDAPAAHTPAVLVPLPHGTVRHVPHDFDVSTLDIDGFMRELGEPVPDLDLYQLWSIARELGAGVDTLLDSGRGRPDAVPRLADRLTSRYGISVRCPLRDAVDADDEDLAALISRTLPPAVARYAARDSAQPVSACDLVLALKDEVAAALAVARPWADSASTMDGLRRLAAGEPADADGLLRAYLVERWLRSLQLVAPGAAPASPAAEPETPEPTEPAEPVGVGDISPEESYWLRWPVRTKMVSPGASLPAALAFHTESALADLRTQRSYAEALRGPWFAVISGKVVAVAQERFSPLWSVHSGLLARMLARLGRRRLPLLAEPWTMQVAFGEVGQLRMTGAVFAALLRQRRWLERLLPDGAPVFPPRPDAVPPGDSAVVRTPAEPDAFAESFVAALRYGLPAEVYQTLAGCALVRADDSGSRVLGFAAGPNAEAVPRAEELVARACADNPAGQGRERTPLLLVFEAPAPRRRERGHDARRLDIKIDRTRTPTG
jgi:hypothetical protein